MTNCVLSHRTYNCRMNIEPCKSRRARLLASMGSGVAVIPTAPEQLRNRDSHYPYRADSYFHYKDAD